MARRGDTKPLCQRAQAGVAFLGASLLPLSDGKTLVLCQDERVKAGQALMRHAWLSVSLVLIRRDASMLKHGEP